MFAERKTSWIIERGIGDEPIAALLEAAIRRDDPILLDVYWIVRPGSVSPSATWAEADRRQHGALLRGKPILAAAAVWYEPKAEPYERRSDRARRAAARAGTLCAAANHTSRRYLLNFDLEMLVIDL